MIDVRVQSGDFDPGRQIERLRELGRAAVVSSVASAEAKDDVEAVVLEHYAAMARPELVRIAEEADARWPLAGILLLHRHGRIAPGDAILLIAVASSDHGAAIEGLAFIADAVRERAPFWRKDIVGEGAGRWVEVQR